MTFFDDGNTRINTSTLPLVGRAVARLLACKVSSDDGADDEGVCLAGYRNRFVRVSSFCVSQRDMLASVLRVTGTEMTEWEVGFEESGERYRRGAEEFGRGDFWGFAKLMYARVFWPDGSGEFEGKGLLNGGLGLGGEDLDEWTRVAVGMEALQG